MHDQTESYPELTFLGAAGTVTGSKFLLSFNGTKILIDCGLFQGLKNLREMNWQPLPLDASEIDRVILTHAHLDHIGYLPRLVNQGFKGEIHCTVPSRDIAEALLVDSAHLQEEDADLANEMGFSKHKPARPLYTIKDVQRTMPLFHTVKDNEWIDLDKKFRFRLRRNGHILGAAFVEVDVNGLRVVFSGDIGRRDDIMLAPPERPHHADYLIIESTYGDRLHKQEDVFVHLRDVVNGAVSRNGILIIPSFTVDRAQDFIYILWTLKQKKEIPDIPIYLDSPMGVDVSKVFCKYDDWVRLPDDVFDKAYASVRTVHSATETEELSKDGHPKIIIAGSGMMNGGRILQYLKMHLPNPDSTIIIPGYQAEGTRGRMIRDGAPEIKIHGEYYEVRAHIEEITSMSSHADQSQILDWLGMISHKPKGVFLVHGEPQAANALRVKIRHKLHWDVAVPVLGETFPLY
jgi:metallo-beta-lactamase family protein